MSEVQFQEWPKIARLNREIIVTEKIDGTNAAVVIIPREEMDRVEAEPSFHEERVRFFDGDASRMTAFVEDHAVFVQSRKRFITPKSDNYGFAGWVERNADALVHQLGPGRHYGEWWGSKIQGGYHMDHKAFSLFNTSRWERDEVLASGIDGLDVVPTLYKGPFSEYAIKRALDDLREDGSLAALDSGVNTKPEAEGVVVFHTAANTAFKVTLKGDEAPKGAAGHARDEG
jgi:hypothetical protein